MAPTTLLSVIFPVYGIQTGNEPNILPQNILTNILLSLLLQHGLEVAEQILWHRLSQ